MSDAVIARQQGDDYQARFFWYKACKLYLRDTNAVRVAWEKNESPGFDDVSIYYSPAKSDKVTGNEIDSEYFQVKFHVDHDKGFTCDALMDCSFIGNKTESLLQRLHKNFKKNPPSFQRSLYHIVNTWGIDNSDKLKNIVDNNGAIRLEKLFDGSTDRSAYGKVRLSWRNHLGLATDDELKQLLTPLRINHNAKGLDYFTEDLNFRLQAVGIQPISEGKRASVFTSLIQQLHAEQRTNFTKDELLEILQKEKLLIEREEGEKEIVRIGIRSFKRGTDTIAFETEDYLCLLHHFIGRFVIDEALWESDILPSLSAFSERVVAHNKPLHIHLDTHHSIAFALGYNLDSKCGVSTVIIQKTRSGRIAFEANLESEEFLKYENAPNWLYDEETIDEAGSDIVLSLNVTHDIKGEVREYVTENLKNVSRIVSATIINGPSPTSIRDGNHILLAVQELVKKLRSTRKGQEKSGFMHLFAAAPNALLFSLGQHFKVFGKLKLYEYDFECNQTGSYRLSIKLPI